MLMATLPAPSFHFAARCLLQGRAAAALFASCFVSGLVHEIIIYYVYRRTTGGEWLAFFTVQVSEWEA